MPPGVSAPGYDPAAVSAGIVHLGLGGFHRAHMARYTHELMELDPAALRWGIVGVGLLPADRRMIDSLAPQDGLYTLIEREGADETVRVIGSLAGLIFAGETTTELLAALDDPAVRIVEPDGDRERLLPGPGHEAPEPDRNELVRGRLRDARAPAQRHRRYTSRR